MSIAPFISPSGYTLVRPPPVAAAAAGEAVDPGKVGANRAPVRGEGAADVPRRCWSGGGPVTIPSPGRPDDAVPVCRWEAVAHQAELARQTAEAKGARDEVDRLNRELALRLAEREATAAALRDRERMLAQTGHMAHVGGWELDLGDLDDPGRNPLRWTDETYRVFGYEPGAVEVSNALFFRHVPPGRAGREPGGGVSVGHRHRHPRGDADPHLRLFMQLAPTASRSKIGLGIGLTLVKSLVELHGGSVEVHSDGPGTGSEFTVRLPLVQGESAEGDPTAGAGTGSSSPRGGTGRRVLVVDDNADAAESLAMLLRLEGHDVRVAYDGRSALELAEADPPEVAFLDLGMPTMDGYELARRFRQAPGLRAVYLVALTGWGQEEDRRRTREAGFDHHLVKPVEPETLHALIAAEGVSGGDRAGG